MKWWLFLPTLLMSYLTAGCLPQNSSPKRDLSARDDTASAASVHQPLYKACAQETCGLARQLPLITAPITESYFQTYEQNLDKSVSQLLSLEHELYVTRKETIRRFSNLRLSNLSDNYRTLINFFHLYNYGEAVSQALTMNGNRIQIDARALAAQLTHLPAHEVKWITQAARAVFESDIYFANYFLSQLPLEIFVRRMYPNKEILPAIADEANYLQTLNNELLENYPILKSQSRNRIEVFSKALKQEPLDPKEKEEFVSSRFTLLSMKELLPRGRWRGIFLARQVDFNQVAQALLKQAESAQLLTLSAEKLNEQLEGAKRLCKLTLTSTIASSPSPEQNQRFNLQLDRVKQEVLQILAQSRYNAPHLQQTLLKLSLLMPPTQQQALTGLKRLLFQEIETNKEMIAKMKSWDPQNQEDRELFVLMLATNFGSDEDNKSAEVYEDVNQFCIDHASQGVEDAAYANYQIVNVGWRSVLYPQFGFGILGHEIAHVISMTDEVSHRPVFSRVKECLKQNQGGREELVEEDFSDLFAIQLMKQRVRENSNFACLLLNQKDLDYSDLSLETRQGAVHPSSFYRLISIATHTQSLTPRCEEAKATHPSGQGIRDCWGR